MTELQYRALIAGIFFGIWPLLMQRSLLPGNVSAWVFGAVSLVIVSPFAFREIGNVPFQEVKWIFGILAGTSGAIGIIAFNGGLSKTTPSTVSDFFVLMMVVQIAVPAVYQVVMTGNLTFSKLFGFAFAGLAAYFLSK